MGFKFWLGVAVDSLIFVDWDLKVEIFNLFLGAWLGLKSNNGNNWCRKI